MRRAIIVLFAISFVSGSLLHADIELTATFVFPGTDADGSNLFDRLPTGAPHDRLGGFSAIEYLRSDRYLILSDRGPGDGAVPFRCRWHEFQLPINAVQKSSGQAKLLGTICMCDPDDRPFLGLSAALDGPRPARGIRFDPEGLRVLQDKVFVSEEYGPLLLEFSIAGRQVGRLPLPDRFSIQKPSASPSEENARNQIGRQSNRGPEGLAITPDGRWLVAAMQGPLIQDAVRKPDGKFNGKFARLVVIDRATNATSVVAYPLEDSTTGISEILAVNDHEFLVLERDSTVGANAKFKQIIRIDIAAASNISDVESLPPAVLPPDIQPVRKEVFLDFLDPKFRLAGERFPEKLEGLTFGPRLKDGRLSLLVTVDNDFEPDHPSLIFCFACSAGELPSFSWKR